MNHIDRLHYVAVTATDVRGLSNREQLDFHYFNPNGLVAEKEALDEQIDRLVADGTVPSGWILAYGSLSGSYSYEELQKLRKLQRVRSIDRVVWIKMLEDRIRQVRIRIAEVI